MIPLTLIPDLSDVGPTVGSILVIGWLFWELYSPLILGVETRLSPLLGIPDRMEDVEETVDAAQQHIEEIDKKQVHHIQVTRAQSRALDEDKDVTISSEEVDQYLVDNGVPVTVFTRESNSGSKDINEYTDNNE